MESRGDAPLLDCNLEHADLERAVQVADRIWWVGHRQAEEFAIFLADHAVAEAATDAERLRERVARLLFAAPMERQIVTVSIGVAIRQPRESF